jgi:hypothetical protein
MFAFGGIFLKIYTFIPGATWAFTEYFFKFDCDHFKIKGILHGDQCILTTLEGFS